MYIIEVIYYWYIFLLGAEWVYIHIDRIPLVFGVGSYLRLEYIVLLVVVVALGYTLGFILYVLKPFSVFIACLVLEVIIVHIGYA